MRRFVLACLLLLGAAEAPSRRRQRKPQRTRTAALSFLPAVEGRFVA